MNSWIVRSRVTAIIASLTAAILLSACSSKPDVTDISKQLAFNCPLWDVKDFKKTDGAEAGKNGYAVAYTFTAEFKGGKRAATEFVSKWLDLADKKEQTRIATIHGGQAEEQEYSKVSKQYTQLFTSCENLEALIWLDHMRYPVEEKLNAGQTEVPIPYALELAGRGLLTKAESGWVLQKVDLHGVTNVIESEPVKIVRAAVAAPAQ